MSAENEPSGGPASVSGEGLRAIWPIQLMHLGVLALVVLIWEFYVPLVVRLPDDLLARVRGYVLYLAPMIAAVLVLNYLWLRPISRQWPAVVAGVVEPARAERLIRRAVGYPYLAFLVALVGTVVTAVVVALIHARLHATPLWRVVELVALASALAVVAALLLFLIGRLATAPWLRTPGLTLPRPGWEPDLRKRLVLVVVCVALVAWLVMGVEGIDRLHRLTDVSGPSQTGALVRLIVGGCVGLIGIGLAAWGAASVLTEGARKLADRMHALAVKVGAAAEGGEPEPVERDLVVPVASPDEIGDLAAAFNRLITRADRDQAELRVSAVEAGRAEERQVEFLATVSASLRTPLHSIIGFAELLIEQVDGPLTDSQDEDVRAVRKAGHHLLSLVDDLVDLTRIDTGHLALNLERVDLARVIDEALEAASGLRRYRPVQLRYEVADEVDAVRADEIRLRQILFNLLGNALKFTDQGEIWVRARRVAGMVEVVVQDSGPGIPAENLERVFVEFEQVRQATDPGSGRKGTGLGLAITRRLVELHGGRIQARNREVGGAEFTFQLPVWDG